MEEGNSALKSKGLGNVLKCDGRNPFLLEQRDKRRNM